VYDSVYGLNHGGRVFALEDVTSHIDTGSTVEDWMATATVTPLGRYGC